jgi:hypothetical protein
MIYTDPAFKAFLTKVGAEHNSPEFAAVLSMLSHLSATQLQIVGLMVDMEIVDKALKRDLGPEKTDNQHTAKVVSLHEYPKGPQELQ